MVFKVSSSERSLVRFHDYAWRVTERLKVDNFKASKGWLIRFQARHRISLRTNSREGADTDKAVVQKWKERVVAEKLEGYKPEDIFNMDESAFFYRILPTKALHFMNEATKGGKLAKKRVT